MSGAGKKVLVLGGTGAMGVYLVPELARMGYQVDVVSLDDVSSADPRISYTQGNAKDDNFLATLLARGYDAIVDFMIYTIPEFTARHRALLEATSHYFFFASYRIYAEDVPLTEESPRLLNESTNQKFLATEEHEYSLYKARQEDIVRGSGTGNWTILRPAITFSRRRFQLVTLEADTLMFRAMNGLPVVLPDAAMGVQATMNWAGDVGRMLARLVLNPKALGQTFTVATAEHHPWSEIAEYYAELAGLRYEIVPVETYLGLFPPERRQGASYQLLYDRCFNRVVDNSLILAATGLSQSDLSSVHDGLRREINALPEGFQFSESDLSRSMTAFFEQP